MRPRARPRRPRRPRPRGGPGVGPMVGDILPCGAVPGPEAQVLETLPEPGSQSFLLPPASKHEFRHPRNDAAKHHGHFGDLGTSGPCPIGLKPKPRGAWQRVSGSCVGSLVSPWKWPHTIRLPLQPLYAGTSRRSISSLPRQSHI